MKYFLLLFPALWLAGACLPPTSSAKALSSYDVKTLELANGGRELSVKADPRQIKVILMDSGFTEVQAVQLSPNAVKLFELGGPVTIADKTGGTPAGVELWRGSYDSARGGIATTSYDGGKERQAFYLFSDLEVNLPSLPMKDAGGNAVLFCPKCGVKISAEDNYCSQCGNKLK